MNGRSIVPNHSITTRATTSEKITMVIHFASFAKDVLLLENKNTEHLSIPWRRLIYSLCLINNYLITATTYIHALKKKSELQPETSNKIEVGYST